MNEESSKDPFSLLNLSKISKNDLSKRDIFGRTILHLLILSNKDDLLIDLLKNTQTKTILNFCDFENGWNCMHYVIFHKRISCFRVLLDYFRGSSAKQNLVLATNSTLLEVLKTKDRSGETPLQLLDNDFKDLLWIPEYINEKNEFHVSYRFQNNKQSEDGKRPSIRSPQIPWNSIRGGSEVYMYGTNTSNQLGFGDSTDRTTPSKLSHNPFKIYHPDHLSIENLRKPRYRQIAVSKYHSIILTTSGELFSCGKGSRGRLGHSNLTDCFKFQQIELDNPVKLVSSHNNHAIAVTTQNEVYSWGLNNFSQLGFESSSKSTSKGFNEKFESTPSLVSGDLKKNKEDIKGLASSKIHVVAFTESTLFFWGLNIGQMGFSSSTVQDVEFKIGDTMYRGAIQATPKAISLRDKVKLVETCETCTFVVTVKNDIHVYYQNYHYKLPKIPVKGSSDRHFDLFKPTSLTKAIKISKLVVKDHKACILLLDNGNVMSFSFNPDDYKNTKYAFVWKAYDHDMVVTDLDASFEGSIVLCTRNGSVFIKSSQAKQRKHSMTEMSLPIPITKNKFKRLNNLNKIVRVFCDPGFSSFGFIRDDIDLLPLKLQKNDFINDLAFLSNINDDDIYRKQDQLLTLDHNFKTFVSNFFYPRGVLHDDSEEHDVLEECGVIDLLQEKYNEKYDPTINKKPKMTETFDLELNTIQDGSHNITSSTSFRSKFVDHPIDHRGYDCFFTFADKPGFRIGFHKLVLQLRSKPARRLIDDLQDDDLLVSANFRAQYHREDNKIEIASSMHSISVALFVHFLYCNDILDLNNEILKSLDDTTLDVVKFRRKILVEVDQLKSIFQIYDTTRTSGVFGVTEIFSDLLEENSGDVIVKLKDDEIRCHSFMLKARSAYFETLLSERWENDGTDFLDFTDVKSTTFEAVLKYIYGANTEQIFDFEYMFEDMDEYINEILELIEISDELLIIQLKVLAQVVLSDLITLDNVLILLSHADSLRAEKLFMNCCWYIYNNLEILLFDPAFTDIPEGLMKRLEQQVLYFQNCKSINFSDDCGVLNKDMLTNWFEKNSDTILETYFNSISLYNETFISDRKGYQGFEPLIDIKYEQVKGDGKKKRDRKNSRKSSTINNDILDFRNSIKARERDFINDVAVQEEKAENREENEDRDFEVVGRGGRRFSKTNGSTSHTPPWTLNGSASSSTTSVASGTDQSRRSQGSIVTPQPPVYSSSEKHSLFPALKVSNRLVDEIPAHKSGLSPYSNWASQSNASPLFSDRSQSMTVVKSGPDSGSDWARKSSNSGSKIKIGPMVKLSQKERKKKMAMESNQDLPAMGTSPKNSQPLNPWAVNSGTAASTEDLSALPILGNSKKQAKQVSKANPKAEISSSQASVLAEAIPSARTPSLTEIMIEESLRVERAKQEETERKTLAEIQQEQEFAKWWEEETLRVQKQMGLLAPEPKPQARGKPKHKKKATTKDTPGTSPNNKPKASGAKKKPPKQDNYRSKSKSLSPTTTQ